MQDVVHPSPSPAGARLDLRPHPRRARLVRRRDVAGPGINARIAGVVTAAIGTMYAFYLFAALMGAWILWQGALASKPFDPFPFAFLLFLGNIVQLLLMPLIMVGQNVQAAHADARAESDFEVNVKAEAEIEKILLALGALDARTLAIVERLAVEVGRAGSESGGSPSDAGAGPG